MVRPLRIEFPGAVYHLTSRGNSRQPIFLTNQDRMGFFEILGDVVMELGWVCHAYCLMTNHYHLLVETPEATLSRGMQRLNGVYTQRFHRTHKSCGHLFQGRFKGILVEKESHLLELSRYIVRNPVAAKMVERVEDYPWSSYLATAGRAPKPDFLNTDWLLEQFAPDMSVAQRAYVEFVNEEKEKDSPWDRLRGGICLGREEFAEAVGKKVMERKDIEAFSRKVKAVDRPELVSLLDGVGRKDKRERAVLECIRWGYTQKEIADFLGLHFSTVSKIVKRGKGKWK